VAGLARGRRSALCALAQSGRAHADETALCCALVACADVRACLY
jgi:hypothetical protein